MRAKKYPGAGKGWRRSVVTHCPYGHLLTGWRKNARDDRRGKVYTLRYCVFCARRRHKRSGRGVNWRRFEAVCPKGHPYEGDNLGIQVLREKDFRMCMTCRRETWARYRAKQREARA